MDLIYTRKVFIKYLFSIFIFLLVILPVTLKAQTLSPQFCSQDQSWIARWTVPTITFQGTGANIASLVSDGDRTTFFQQATGSPWTFEVDFGLVRNLTGLKIFTPAKINSPGSYEIFIQSDLASPFVSVQTGIVNPIAGQDFSINFGTSYYKARKVRIVFYDVWSTTTTRSVGGTLNLYEINFFQCGVDPLIAKQIPQSAVPAPSLSCADEVSGNKGGIINTYWPGNANATAGIKSVNIDMANVKGAAHPLVAGDRVLIIQMQNTLISEFNTNAYGDGIDNDLIASGWVNVQNTGEYEFGIVESISGNVIQLTQPLQKSYSAANAFQVVYSPVFDNVTITSTVLAYAWDGHCGGIVTFDAKTLNLNGQTIQVSGLGFRGGKKNSNGNQPAVQYWGIYCTDNQLMFGEKGEGIAGSPIGSWSGSKRLYSPEGANGGGSYARGAPGNAGGGGNDHNSGGGGGGNIGSGGQGGASWGGASDMTAYWNSVMYDGYVKRNQDFGFVPNGGMGGTGCKDPDPFRIWLGGGGGGGHQNDNAATGGANGGGIILITAQKVTGTGSLLANGENANKTIYCTTCNPATIGNDGAGGGGAGGTIVFGFEDQNGATINYSATGGSGGDVTATDAPHGPGGGGGGGAIIVSALPLNPTNVNVVGGVNGIYLKTGSPWGANNGQEGQTFLTDKLKTLYTYTCDHGDAPFSYGDAAHQLKLDMPSLRTPGDAEPMALNQPPHDRDALGDDLNGAINDEDGVYLPFDTLTTAQSFYKVKINVQNPQKVDVIVSGWIDFNGNGRFDDNERISLSGPISGDTVLIWKSFPSDITGGDSFARFRISTGNEALQPIGVAPDGEAEDYTLYINAFPHAVPDTTCTHAGLPVKIFIVANDKVQGDKRGKITIKTLPINGTATINDNGTPDDKTDDYITYVPNPGYQGVDTLTYELWNSIGNREAAKVTITVKQPITVDFKPNPPEGCSPLSVAFTNLSSDPTAKYTWNYGDKSPLEVGFQPVHVFSTKDTIAVYTVKLQMNTGCGIIETTKQVTVHPIPHAVPTEKSNGEKPEIVVFNDVSTNVVNRIWTVDGSNVGSSQQITAKFDSVGPHIIALRVFNDYDCFDDTVFVHTTLFRNLYVPNAFIPGSSDKMVNTFKPVGFGLKEYTLMIFDMWGNLIWSDSQLINSAPANGWDGNDKHGKPLPTDTYIWRIKAVLEGNKPWKGMKMPNGSYHTEGPVTIIR
jgi:PKD repeat protein